MSRRLTGIAVATLVALTLAGCMSAEESSAFAAMNGDRTGVGVYALAEHSVLTSKAQGWANHLAAVSGGACTLSHSSLAANAPGGWRMLGENVACRTSGDIASAVAGLEAQLWASPDHHANIVNPSFNWAGVGMAQSGNTVFLVQEFAQI